MRRLAVTGCKVAIFDLNAELGGQLAEEIDGVFVAVDVRDEEQVTKALDKAADAHRAARILVNCAGVGLAAKAVDREGVPQPLDDFRKVIEINLIGTFNVLSKFAARAMTLEPIGEERELIVNTASVAAFDGQICQPAYSASKGGIVAMTLPLAREFARGNPRHDYRPRRVRAGEPGSGSGGAENWLRRGQPSRGVQRGSGR